MSRSNRKSCAVGKKPFFFFSINKCWQKKDKVHGSTVKDGSLVFRKRAQRLLIENHCNCKQDDDFLGLWHHEVCFSLLKKYFCSRKWKVCGTYPDRCMWSWKHKVNWSNVGGVCSMKFNPERLWMSSSVEY